MNARQGPLTYDDLREIPDDGMRREVIGGEPRMHPATTAGHQEVVGNIYLILRNRADALGGKVYLAPFDVILHRFDIVQPDLIYLSPARSILPSDRYYFEGTPDLVVEAIGPGTGWIDRARKMALYATHRVPEYWIADPERRLIVVHVLHGEEYRAVELSASGMIPSTVLPGLVVDPAEVFAGLD